MKLLTKELEAKLRANAKAQDPVRGTTGELDHTPVVKFFNPCGAYTGIFTELDEDGDTLFGLADHGFGTPELGYSSLQEIAAVRCPPLGLPIERDKWFKGDKTLNAYADEARKQSRIVA